MFPLRPHPFTMSACVNPLPLLLAAKQAPPREGHVCPNIGMAPPSPGVPEKEQAMADDREQIAW